MGGMTCRVRAAAAALALVIGLATVAVAGPADGRVDINQATAEELIALPGIAQAKAQAIIEYRQREPFRTVEDLKKVRGIGDATFERLKDLVTVGDSSVPAR